ANSSNSNLEVSNDSDANYSGEQTVRSIFTTAKYCNTSSQSESSNAKKKPQASLCSAAKCKNNPNCLKNFSLAKWNATNALATFLRIANTSHTNVTLQRRANEMPIGLKNLAATCYLNTLLQVWFHTIPFRSAVYNYRLGSPDSKSDTIIKNLQIAFAYMQYGAKNVFDPTAFVKSLNIDSGVQQDAQEFSKLFLGIMETVFDVPGQSSGVRRMVNDLFEGKCSYITRCKICGNESCRDEAFRDIELSITEKGTLKDSIAKYLTEEHMDDDNKWYCASCTTKQPAIRQIKFAHLPSVLNIQLLRFVYDVQRQTKRKVKTSMQFPEVLDMQGYVGVGGMHAAAAKEEHTYVLTAVLMHRGTSAYSGHFIARIRDPRKGTGVWYTFNDEAVTRLESVGFDVVDVDIYDDVTSTEEGGVAKKRKTKEDANKKKTTEPGAKSDDGLQMDEKMFSSSVAYMLIYTRESEWKRSKEASDDCNPPTALLDEIRSMNSAFLAQTKEFDDRQEALTKEFEQMKSIRTEVLSKGSVFSDDEPSYYVDSDEIREWLREGMTAPEFESDFETLRTEVIKSGDAAKPETTTTAAMVEKNMEFDNKALLCEHKKLNFRVLHKAKRLSMEAGDLLVSKGFYFNPPLTDKDFCQECASSVLGERKHLSSHAANLEMFKEAQDTDFSVLHWISSVWLQEWSKKNPNFNTNGTTIPLPISDPFLSDTRTLISSEAFGVLKLIFCNELDALPRNDVAEHCSVCEMEHQALLNDKAGMREIASLEKSKLRKLADGKQSSSTLIPTKASCFYLVPGGFIEHWRKFLRNPNQVNRPGEIDNRIFICEHDLLCFDPSDSDEKAGIKYFVLLDPEWIQLLEWYNANLIIEGKRGQRPDGSFYFTFDPPVCLDCKNNRLKNKKDVLIQLRNITTQSESPPSKKPAEEEGTNGNVVDLTKSLSPPPPPSLPVSNGKRKAPPVSSLYGNVADATPVRQSRRLMEKKYIEFRMDKSKTILDLKTQICEKWGVPPIHQQLFFRSQELTAINATIESLEVNRTDVFEVILLTEKKGMLLFENEDSVFGGGGQSKEMGFAGSNLMNFGTAAGSGAGGGSKSKKGVDDDDVVMQNQNMMDEQSDDDLAVAKQLSLDLMRGVVEEGWNCSTCTFINGLNDESCSMCGTAHV
ncbi:hypothetical protein BDR26DRAFT_867537, partial [Obelidium mucronatum]